MSSSEQFFSSKSVRASAEDEVPSCDRGDTCCVRTFSVLPFETPEGQEDDKSKGLASALMGSAIKRRARAAGSERAGLSDRMRFHQP